MSYIGLDKIYIPNNIILGTFFSPTLARLRISMSVAYVSVKLTAGKQRMTMFAAPIAPKTAYHLTGKTPQNLDQRHDTSNLLLYEAAKVASPPAPAHDHPLLL